MFIQQSLIERLSVITITYYNEKAKSLFCSRLHLIFKWICIAMSLMYTTRSPTVLQMDHNHCKIDGDLTIFPLSICLVL